METDSLDAVDLVDTLMTYFRNGGTPPDKMVIRAYELGINVEYLRRYIQEIEQHERQDIDE